MSAASYQQGIPLQYHAAAPPPKLGAPTMVAAFGCIAMLVALLLVITGVPAKLFYDQDAKGSRAEIPAGPNVTAISAALDENIKYIRDGTDSDPTDYNGILSQVNHNSRSVPALAKSVNELNTSAASIDRSLTSVHKTTVQMRKDMQAMAATSRASAATIVSVNGQIVELKGAMGKLYKASQQLTNLLGSIGADAAKIRTERILPVKAETRSLNGVLPEHVPAPITSLDAPAPAAGRGGPAPAQAGIAVHPEGAQ